MLEYILVFMKPLVVNGFFKLCQYEAMFSIKMECSTMFTMISNEMLTSDWLKMYDNRPNWSNFAYIDNNREKKEEEMKINTKKTLIEL